MWRDFCKIRISLLGNSSALPFLVAGFFAGLRFLRKWFKIILIILVLPPDCAPEFRNGFDVMGRQCVDDLKRKISCLF